MLRVVIADPDELLGLRMSGRLSGAECLEVVGRGRDCSSVLELVRHTRPDVVLVDLFLPPLGGVALIAAIKHAVPDTQVVVLVAEAREATLQAAYAAGALGFVTKDGSVQQVHGGIGWFSPVQGGESRPPALCLVPGTGGVRRRFTAAGA